MLLRQLKYYQSVVRLNSFTEAATECHISQSAISQQIQALERNLGVPLLQRSGRRFILTPAGEYFYRKSLVLTADLERFIAETIQLAHKDENEFRIGYLNSCTNPELQLALAEFFNKHPDILIRTIPGTHRELYCKLQENTVDIVLKDQSAPFSNAYVSLPLAVNNYYVEISSRSPLAQLSSITPEELKNTPCILVASREQQDAERKYYQDVFGFSGHFLFVEHLEAAQLMVAGNQGFLPVQSVSPPVYPGSMICRLPLFQDGKPMHSYLCAFWKADNSRFFVQEFAELLKEKFSSNAAPE